ncbi:MAG: hypothetical protein M3018_12890 [Actinomycetota bacterium]|nr:hypothetical protein [Actinomycetota bacterium]
MLAVLGVLSLWTLFLDLRYAHLNHLVWTGTNGPFLVDQMQYLAWIRDAAAHGLASNLFVLHHTAHDYFQPAIEISAGLTWLGVAPYLALLVWKPIGVLAIFFAVRVCVRRMIEGKWPRRAALVLALFFGFIGVLGDEWLPFWSWGYDFGLLSVGSLTAALVVYDRGRRTGRPLWAAPLLGALTSALHPWQGEVLIVAVILAEIMVSRRPQIRRLAVATVLGTALPLVYYAILNVADPSWKMAQAASTHNYTFLKAVLPLVPLLLPSLLFYRRRAETFLAATMKTWPLGILAIYLLSSVGIGGGSLHSFAGVTIPLGISAVWGINRLDFGRFRLRWVPARRLVTALVIAALTIPGTSYMLRFAVFWVSPKLENANYITEDERHALEYLDHAPGRGTVVTTADMGPVVPGLTGRATFLGDPQWSLPGWQTRFEAVFRLFRWPYADPAEAAFIWWTNARFVFADCRSSYYNLDRKLFSLIRDVHHFGCATVYDIK